jgi:hypothetical protein
MYEYLAGTSAKMGTAKLIDVADVAERVVVGVEISLRIGSKYEYNSMRR